MFVKEPAGDVSLDRWDELNFHPYLATLIGEDRALSVAPGRPIESRCDDRSTGRAADIQPIVIINFHTGIGINRIRGIVGMCWRRRIINRRGNANATW